MNQETNINTLYMGGCVNQELVAHLSQGVRIFKDYEVYMEIYNKGKEEICEIMKVHEKVEKKWKWITIGGPIIIPLFFPAEDASYFFITGAMIVATQCLKMLLMGNDTAKANAICEEAKAKGAILDGQKEQKVNQVIDTFGYVHEQYRSSYIMSYMLELAKAGKIQTMEQGFILADEELRRLTLKETQRSIMESKRKLLEQHPLEA